MWRLLPATESQQQWACVATLEDAQSRTVRSAEFSPCGSYLAAASFDASVVIWQRGKRSSARDDGSSAENGVMSWECVSTLEGHENEVKSVAWSPDGKILATCSRDKSIWLWEAPPSVEPDGFLPNEELDCECISVLTGHLQDVKFVLWHPLEPLLFSASYDDTIRVWAEQIDDWGCVDVLGGHTNTVWGISFDPQGIQLASCGQDCTVKIWSRDSKGKWTLSRSIEGRHERTIFSIHWSHDGTLIATGAGDDAICIQDGNDDEFTIRKVTKFAHASDVNCVRFCPKVSAQMRLLATVGDDSAVRIWNLVSFIS